MPASRPAESRASLGAPPPEDSAARHRGRSSQEDAHVSTAATDHRPLAPHAERPRRRPHRIRTHGRDGRRPARAMRMFGGRVRGADPGHANDGAPLGSHARRSEPAFGSLGGLAGAVRGELRASGTKFLTADACRGHADARVGVPGSKAADAAGGTAFQPPGRARFRSELLLNLKPDGGAEQRIRLSGGSARVPGGHQRRAQRGRAGGQRSSGR